MRSVSKIPVKSQSFSDEAIGEIAREAVVKAAESAVSAFGKPECRAGMMGYAAVIAVLGRTRMPFPVVTLLAYGVYYTVKDAYVMLSDIRDAVVNKAPEAAAVADGPGEN